MSADFIIDVSKGDHGYLVTSAGPVLKYKDKDNIDDKVESGKVIGELSSGKIQEISNLLVDASQGQLVDDSDDDKKTKSYVGYLFVGDDIIEVPLEIGGKLNNQASASQLIKIVDKAKKHKKHKHEKKDKKDKKDKKPTLAMIIQRLVKQSS